MKITYLSPSFRPHGGIRVLAEHANRLAERGHDVTLQSLEGPYPRQWVDFSPKLKIRYGSNVDWDRETVYVAGSPPVANVLEKIPVKKVFFLQMAEHLFAPTRKDWWNTCVQSYKVKMPIIGISRWVEQEVKKVANRAIEHYIGNGVSEDFKPGEKDQAVTVMVEGWEGYNDAKDKDGFGPQLAAYVKSKYGARIIVYGQHPPTRLANVVDEFHNVPTQSQLVRLYQRAHFLIKCSKYDARSCAPVEAMACGTPTVRMIFKGDDDLIDGVNCAMHRYSMLGFVHAQETIDRWFENPLELEQLRANGFSYRRDQLNWNKWIDRLEQIFATL